MNDLIVIPEENIDIIMPSYKLPESANRSNSIVIFKTTTTILVYLFVSIMILWLLGIFSGCIETSLTVVYASMIASALIIKLIKSL